MQIIETYQLVDLRSRFSTACAQAKGKPGGFSEWGVNDNSRSFQHLAVSQECCEFN
jgi:hypothetical protein